MKPTIRRYLELLPIVTLFAIAPLTAFAEGGDKAGGGGDAVAADFVKYARYSIELIRRDAENNFDSKDSSLINAAIPTVQVYGYPNKQFCTPYKNALSGRNQ